MQRTWRWLRSLDRATLLPFIVAFLAAFLVEGIGNSQFLFPKADDTWDEMVARGTWRIGIDPSFPPFEYLDENGAVIGFDVALAQEIASQWGMIVEIVPIGFDSLIDAVQTGQVDSVVSALPYDPRLTKDLAYSQPYFDGGVRLAVRLDSDLVAESQRVPQEANGPDEAASQEAFFALLAGRKIGVEWGGMSDMIGRRIQQAGHPLELTPLPSPDETIIALISNLALDAILIDNVTLVQAQKVHPIIGIGPMLESNPYVIASPIEATTLHDKIDQALTLLHDNKRFDRLIQAWF